MVDYYKSDDFLHISNVFRDLSSDDHEPGYPEDYEHLHAAAFTRYMWFEHFGGYEVNEEVCLLPADANPSDMPGHPVKIFINTRHAFGDGSHPTTMLCLNTLIDHLRSFTPVERAGMRLLDAGAGTGVLSICASKYGVGTVHAVELNASAVDTARDNFIINGCTGITIDQGDITAFRPEQEYDIVIANLISDVLIRTVDSMKRMVRPGGVMITSGVSELRFEDVRACFIEHGLVPDRIVSGDGWYCFVIKIPGDVQR